MDIIEISRAAGAGDLSALRDAIRSGKDVNSVDEVSWFVGIIIIIIITLQYDVHVIEGEGLQSVSEQVVGVHTDRICQVDIPGLKLNLLEH